MDIETTNLLSHLKNETKLEILSAIYFKGDISVNRIVELSGKNRKNVSKQINEMISINLLTKEIIGRYHMISFNKELSDDAKEICQIIIKRFINERRMNFKGEENE